MYRERRGRRHTVLVALPEPSTAGEVAHGLDKAGLLPCLVFQKAHILAALHRDRFRLLLIHRSFAEPELVDSIRSTYGSVDLPLVTLSEMLVGDLIPDGVDLELPHTISGKELAASCLALISISTPSSLPASIAWGPFELDIKTRRASWNGRSLALTPTEFRIMEVLIFASGGVVTWKQLSRRVWGPDVFEDGERVLAHVRRIRKKIETNTARPEFLLTIRGEGYRLAEHDAGEPSLDLSALEPI